MYGRKSSLLIRALLFFLSLLYHVAVRLRLAVYEYGILKTRKLPFPVISVGNITLGGTGKTPAVIEIATFLQQHSRKPVILSRGYGRRDSEKILVVSNGSSSAASAEVSGDEPALMASLLQNVPVVVGQDRYLAGREAYARFQPDVALLDDGFQHIRLHRDLNICLIDGLAPFGTGNLFPAGILREPVSGLQRADAVLITRSDRSPDCAELKRRIGKFTTAPIFTSRHVPVCLVDLDRGKTISVESLKGMPVVAFSGIAKPESFTSILRDLGADVRTVIAFSDHYRYSSNDLETVRVQAQEVGASMIVTTEKDGVKLRELAHKDIMALRICLEIIEKDAWERVLLAKL